MDLINDDQTDFAHVPLALRLRLKVVFLGMIAVAKTGNPIVRLEMPPSQIGSGSLEVITLGVASVWRYHPIFQAL